MFEIINAQGTVVGTAVSFVEACRVVDHHDYTLPAAGPHTARPVSVEAPVEAPVAPARRPSLMRRLFAAA